MRFTHSWIIPGLFVAVLGAAGALAFAGCGNNLDDCRNTRTCIALPCMDGGALDTGECCEGSDGGLVCAP
jgi:hypothetical protein